MTWISGKPIDPSKSSVEPIVEKGEDYETITLMRLMQAQKEKADEVQSVPEKDDLHKHDP